MEFTLYAGQTFLIHVTP